MRLTWCWCEVAAHFGMTSSTHRDMHRRAQRCMVRMPGRAAGGGRRPGRAGPRVPGAGPGRPVRGAAERVRAGARRPRRAPWPRQQRARVRARPFRGAGGRAGARRACAAVGRAAGHAAEQRQPRQLHARRGASRRGCACAAARRRSASSVSRRTALGPCCHAPGASGAARG